MEEIVQADLDLSNTIGWFTNLYPIALSMKAGIGLGEFIKTIKEQLRSIPSKGIGYGVLRYLNPTPAIRATLKDESWDIIFNYLGQLDNVIASNALFQPAQENIGDAISPNLSFPHKLVINSLIKDQQLVMNWTYSQDDYYATTITRLAENYTKQLTALIHHCCEKQHQEWTPSDYGLQGKITDGELKELLDEPDDLEGEELLRF